MRGKKTDTKIKKEIIKKKLNNPDLSSRDIEKALGSQVSNDTICDVINNDLPQVATESKRIAELIDRNNDLISLADQRLKELLKNPEEKLRATDLVSVRESGFKQNQLLTGKATENVKHDIDISKMTPQQITEYINSKLA